MGTESATDQDTLTITERIDRGAMPWDEVATGSTDTGPYAWRLVSSGVYRNHTVAIFAVMERHYCAYMRTPFQGGGSYDDLHEYIKPHGGLTYGIDADGWIGFDFGHAYDICVDEDGETLSMVLEPWIGSSQDGRLVWSPSKVKAEVESAVDQLIELEHGLVAGDHPELLDRLADDPPETDHTGGDWREAAADDSTTNDWL